MEQQQQKEREIRRLVNVLRRMARTARMNYFMNDAGFGGKADRHSVDQFNRILDRFIEQVHGGAMQGIGQALMERAYYDPSDGQLVTATFMDYALPRAADGPSFVFETHNVPCKTNPLGVKGAGEAGAIGSCPALVNAIIEGLWREYNIDHIDMPATPERVWIAIREHQRQHSL